MKMIPNEKSSVLSAELHNMRIFKHVRENIKEQEEFNQNFICNNKILNIFAKTWPRYKIFPKLLM